MRTGSGNQDTRRDGKRTEISRQIETKRKLDPQGAVRFVRKSVDHAIKKVKTVDWLQQPTRLYRIIAAVERSASFFSKNSRKSCFPGIRPEKGALCHISAGAIEALGSVQDDVGCHGRQQAARLGIAGDRQVGSDRSNDDERRAAGCRVAKARRKPDLVRIRLSVQRE